MARARSKSAFPVFNDGDVELCLTRNPADRYVLHSVVLKIHSSFFEASLSSQWTPPSSETTAEGGMKWTYELQFSPGTLIGIFVKVRSTAVVESASTYTTANTAEIYLSEKPWAPTTENLTASRLQVIEAHRHFLRILYHQPPTLPTKDFESTITLVMNIVNTADKYCALAAVSWLMENHLVRHFETDAMAFCTNKPHQALPLSLWIRSGWLFREAAGRLISAPHWEDVELVASFEDLGVVPFLLHKRTELRAMLRHVDTKLLTLELLAIAGRHDINIKVAVYVFRELMVRYYKEDRWEDWRLRPSKWPKYAKLYRTIAYFGTHWTPTSSLTLLDDSGLAALADRPRFIAAFKIMLDYAAQAVAPLMKTTLSRDVGEPHLLLAGLTCIEIGEEELPWKGKAW